MKKALYLLAALAALSSWPAMAQHRLPASPQTVVWGYYDATSEPVLRIASGDTVQIHTLIVTGPDGLEAAGLPPEQVEPALRDVHAQVARGGPHILTGPIYIEEAMPGDVLQVNILSVQPAVPYATNTFSRGGFLGEEFAGPRTRLFPLDLERGVAQFGDGIEIPLRPFFGSMGVAPPPDAGRLGSGPPWIHAGNLDNKELVAGTTLFIPVHVPGALFQAGDGHAAQGDGEVSLTALETSLEGELEFIVRKDMGTLTWPRAETPEAYITMGMDENLEEAARIAVREMIAFLVAEKQLSADDAYMLTSMAVDLRITQLVDGKLGVHAMLWKSLFTP
ncbi:MAG TPA: acetamidase/formamidase family protein [Hyphomicrobiales bacterium]|nr:acetamidase/formamidase family protein [Hyphomicrobiales bacterium]